MPATSQDPERISSRRGICKGRRCIYGRTECAGGNSGKEVLMRRRRQLCLLAAIFAAVCLILGGCTDTKSQTPGMSEQPAVPEMVNRTLPKADRDAFSAFFSRWSAYTLALGTGAADLGEVYTALARIADTWTDQAYCTSTTGPSYVNLTFEDGGRLALEAKDGEITSGTVTWSAPEEENVSATLTTMVASNALAYGLCATSDAAGAQNVYSACIDTMNRDADGMLSGGPETLGSYAFSITVNPEDQVTTFRGTRV